MISSAQATDASAAPMFAASFRVMTVTVSFTRGSVAQRPAFPVPGVGLAAAASIGDIRRGTADPGGPPGAEAGWERCTLKKDEA